MARGQCQVTTRGCGAAPSTLTRDPAGSPAKTRAGTGAQAGELDGAIRDRDRDRVGCPYHSQCTSPGAPRSQCPDAPELPTSSPGRAHSGTSAPSQHQCPSLPTRSQGQKMDRAVSLSRGAPVGRARRAPRPWQAVLGVGLMAGGGTLWQFCVVATASSSCPSPVRLTQHHAGSPWVGVPVCPHAVTMVQVLKSPSEPLDNCLQPG